jgi:hypothetical protein
VHARIGGERAYLLPVDTPEVYDEFVKKGLGPEREYHDLVQANIAERGGIATPMEDLILQSILRVIQQSGMRIDEIPVRHQDWGVNMRDKIRASDGTACMFRIIWARTPSVGPGLTC